CWPRCEKSGSLGVAAPLPPDNARALGQRDVPARAKPSTGTRRLATGSTARKRLSRATAPRSGGPLGAMRHGAVTAAPSSTSLTSATGHDARWPPVMRAARVRRATNPGCVANASGTTSSVAPVSTSNSTSALLALHRPRGEPRDVIIDEERVDDGHRDRPEQRGGHELAPVEDVAAEQLGDGADRRRAHPHVGQ